MPACNRVKDGETKLINRDLRPEFHKKIVYVLVFIVLCVIGIILLKGPINEFITSLWTKEENIKEESIKLDLEIRETNNADYRKIIQPEDKTDDLMILDYLIKEYEKVKNTVSIQDFLKEKEEKSPSTIKNIKELFIKRVLE